MTILVSSPRHLCSEDPPREARSRDVLAYLHTLAGREPPDSLFELRYRAPSGPMRQHFVPLSRAREAADAIVLLADNADVYAGCAPRTKRFGGKDAVERVWTLWAYCDGIAASSRLTSFAPAPAVVVRSGSGRNRHAY